MAKNKRNVINKEIIKASKNKGFLVVVFVYLILSIISFVGLYFYGDKLVNKINNKEFLNNINFEGGLKLSVIDVNQGDAIFIDLPDGKTMLIDSGDRYKSDKNKFETFIKDTFKNREKVLDYCLLTHPDSDHVGSMDFVFDYFEVKTAYRPNVYVEELEEVPNGAKTVSSVVYSTYVEKMLAEGCEIIINEAGNVIEDEAKTYKFTFYSPNKFYYNNVNDYSPIIVLEAFGERICLTGDAEKMAESEVIDVIPSCSVLKAGHHGASTSTSIEFLNKLTPKYVLVSCGKNNKYNHPTSEFLSRVNSCGFVKNVFRTDEIGTISMFVNEELSKKNIIYFYGADNITIESLYVITFSSIMGMFVVTIVVLNVVYKNKTKKR